MSETMTEVLKQRPLLDLSHVSHVLHALMVKEHMTRLRVSKLDLESYNKDYEKAKKVAEFGKSPGYYMFYYRKLDCVAPLAIQNLD
jgi:hypothetical protein